MNPVLTSFQARIEAMCAQQDYGWFVAIVLAGGVLLLWWRHPQRGARDWIAWGATTTVFQSVAGIGAFLLPYNERSDPGVDSLPPHILSDMIMGGMAALLAVAWTWDLSLTSGRSRWWRAMSVAAFTSLWWLRKDHPVAAGWALVGALTLLLPILFRRHGCNWLTASAVLQVAAALLSPWGPLAAVGGVLQRGRDWSGLSIVCPALLAAAQFAALIGLAVEMLNRLPVDRRREQWEPARPFIVGAAAWLVVGLLMAVIAARNTRHTFEAAALSRVVTAAALFDPRGLPEALGSRFRPVPTSKFHSHSGIEVPLFRAEGTADEKIEPAMAQLYRLFALNLDLTYVCISLPRAGQMFEAIPMRRARERWGVVYPLRALTPADNIHWIERKPHTEIATTPSGTMFLARAPLVSDTAQRIGWLQFDFCVPLWAAAQAQARLLAFAVVGMGLGLISLSYLRLQREREKETALRAASAAEEANRLKTTFLANVSHELRTPIQSVLGYAELLHGSLRGEVEHTRLSALRQHGELMIRLVNDLIDLAMLDSGAFRLVEKPFALRHLVTEVVESFRTRAEAKGLRLVCRIDDEVPTWVVSDPERLRQVLLNLVGNALKYTERGRVDVLLTPKSEENGHQRVELVVRDTGPGIGFEEQRWLFEPFSRLANAERKEGAGLGLALTAGLCRRLGDGLALESDGVSGSLFRTTLRLRVGTAPAARRVPESDALAGWRILVADDNALVRELFVAYLTELGAECIAVDNGESAVTYAADPRWNALVLDLAMPGLDGNQVARRVRAAGGKLRIVGVSAHAGGFERVEALAAGMDDFLLKPIELPALAIALRPHCAAPQPLPEAWAHRREQWEHALKKELPLVLAQLSLALDRAAWPLLQERAHYLRNSAMVVRDDELFNACGAIELAAEREDLAAAQTGWARCAQVAERWSSSPKESRPQPRSLQPEPSTQ